MLQEENVRLMEEKKFLMESFGEVEGDLAAESKK